MKLLKTKHSTKFFSTLKDLLRPAFESIGLKLRLGARVRLMNIRATANPRKYMLRFLSVFGILLVINILLCFLPTSEKDNSDFGIATVSPAMNGFNQLQNMKDSHDEDLKEMRLKAVVLKHDLDSLIAIEHKTYDDSLKIMKKHRQVQIIVNNLYPKNNEKN